MTESLFLDLFDELVNPILLCEKNGIIFFKNKAAVRELPRPKTGASLLPYLSSRDRLRFLPGEKTAGDLFPAFLELTDRGERCRAFADTIRYNGRTAVLLISSPLFFCDLSLPIYQREGALLKKQFSFDELLSRLEALAESDRLMAASRRYSLHRKMTALFYRLIHTTLQNVAADREQLYFRLDKTVSALSYACDSVFGRFGREVLFEADTADLSLYFIEFRPFLLLVSLLILCVAELTEMAVTIRLVRRNEEQIELLLSVTADRTGNSDSVDSSDRFGTLLLPGRTLDLFFFEKFLSGGRYAFATSSKQEENGALTLSLSAPIYPARRLREKEELILEEILSAIDHRLTELLSEDKPDSL